RSNISSAKNSMLLPANYPVRNYRDEVMKRVYERYQQLLDTSNAVDFDDLLLWAVRLLDENPEVREKYAQRFEHVLVDEFQDTNMAQYKLLGLLTSGHHNLFVVGDEDQSIYRWRGADSGNVLRFEQEYPKLQKVLLEQNYRSTQTVLDAARSVIVRNQHRTPKHLFSERGRGEPVILYEAADDHAEAAYVVDTIRQLMVGERMPGGDFAVMYRTNAQSRLLEEAFFSAGLPYRLVGAQRFYGRREVKDIIAVLRLVENPADEISLLRVINVPPRGIGGKTLESLQLAASKANCSPAEVLLDLGRQGQASSYWAAFSGRGANVLADFGALLVGWRETADTAGLPELFDRILSDINYHAYIADGTEEGNDRWDNVQELRKLAYQFQQQGLTAFLESLALVSDQDTLPEQTDAPTLLTLHTAKGLEFSHVFIIGMDEGLLPHSRALDDPEEMAEERRLFYVGLTRAKNRLYLTRAAQRTSYGSFEYTEPSRFVEDIPAGLLKRQGVQMLSSRPATDWAAPRWQGTTLAPTPPPATPVGRGEAQFRPAMRVRHPTWGEGMVIESRLQDGDETVDVVFESVGIKRLVASMARLEIIRKA
ncbi:MAG: 3'-5' exonuclease, partial [Anaerolineaceae bacterium]|nr:3'-5' exonuclease [Anaerolineaceae bacterium]